MKKRLLSMLLICCMALALLPAAALADTGNAIQLGTGGISGYDSATDKYNYVYYGTWNGSPIKWRVLDNKTNTGESGLFLLSDKLLADKVVYSPAYIAWQGSGAQKWCKDFAGEEGSEVPDAFSAGELGAILNTTKTDGEFLSRETSNRFRYSENILNGDKVFFLSAEEAENPEFGFANEEARIEIIYGRKRAWWTRSLITGSFGVPGIITPDGQSGIGADNFAARPAFNLNESFVVLASAAEGGKNASGMDGGLATVSGYAGGEWKLTVKDAGRSSFTANITNDDGNMLTVSYANAKTGNNEFLSAVIKDKNGNATYYGRILQLDGNTNGQSGTASITLPNDFDRDNDTLYVFNEQCNGNNVTDYASEPVAILAPPTYTVNFDPNGGGSGMGDVTGVSGEFILPECSFSAPNGTMEFDKWDVGGVLYAPGEIINVSNDVTIKAVWKNVIFYITFDPNGGIVSTTSAATDNKGKLAGLPMPIQSGFRFDGWYTERVGGSMVSADETYSADIILYAHWTYVGGENYHTIAAVAGDNGSISPAGVIGVYEGSSQTFIITPNNGYRVLDVKIDGRSIGAVAAYTFENVTGDHIIEASFAKAALIPQTGDGGSAPIYIAMLVAGALALAVTALYRRREN